MSSETEYKVSPMMAQWHACKKMSKDAVLFFRMGDFYEAFYEDAVLVAKELDLTLTKRQDIPMSGVPYHTSEPYIDKLVGKGYRVAVAEQMEDPKKVKGIVKREVVRIVTPGTLINSSLLSDKSNNFFACVTQLNTLYGLAFIDLTTSEFRVAEFEELSDVINELFRLKPAEFLVSEKFKERHQDPLRELRQSYSFLLNSQEDWRFDHQITHNFLTNHFKVHNLDGFGLKGMVAGINATGALLQYIQEQLCLTIDHIVDIQTYSTSQFMLLDRNTQRNLELTESLNDLTRKNTLLDILDHTQTPMGARLMRHWIKQPLLSPSEIELRQDCIQIFLQHAQLLDRFSSHFGHVRDLERLMMRISSGNASPRDLLALKVSMEALPPIKTHLQTISDQSALLKQEEQKIELLPDMVHLIAQAISDEPPLRITEGNIFRDGFHPQLDELRLLCRDSQSWILQYQNHLREQTGIKTLKVGFTRMFGYYIEVSKGQADKMPDTFQRRQTLVNAERFITPELKDFETKVLTAEEKIFALENELFNQLRLEIAKYTSRILKIAQAIAKIDCLLGLAIAAKKNNYCRPFVDYSQTLQIIEGRHPVIEAINLSEKFIPNDTLLDQDKNRLLLITGPNMAGKSTFIRQVALITIMAQIGSFIPAKSAHIGIVDKVFTRIGASDDLSKGQSTFMVEMTETANILHNATSRSLVILDEIGRGTSTYDGISIAWSVAEYLLTAEGKLAKTLFATHYWELTKLEEKIPGAVNYSVAVHENEENIIFLRKIVKGGTDKSYGIHVARLAGLPLAVLQRAKEILEHLEENSNRKNAFEPVIKFKKSAPKNKTFTSELQLSLFGN